MSIKTSFNSDTIRLMSLFEKITKAHLKDCFSDQNDLLLFVVNQGDLWKAVGKKAANVKKLEGLLNRKIKIVGFDSDMKGFINNLIFPLKIKNIIREEDVLTLEPEDTKTRGLLIGRNAKNLRNYEEIIKKYFTDIKELKVAKVN